MSNANGEVHGYFFSQEGTTSQMVIGAMNSDDCYPQVDLFEGRISEKTFRLKRPTVNFVVDFSDYAQGEDLKNLDLVLVHTPDNPTPSCGQALIYQNKVNVQNNQVLELKIYPMGMYTFQMSGHEAGSLSSIMRSFTFNPEPSDTLIVIEIEQ